MVTGVSGAYANATERYGEGQSRLHRHAHGRTARPSRDLTGPCRFSHRWLERFPGSTPKCAYLTPTSIGDNDMNGLRIAAGAALAGIVLTGTIAYAAVPTGGVITGCYAQNGTLRVVDPSTAACKGNETTIQWNQTGPVGPAGPQGPMGSRGPEGLQGLQGPQGPSGTDGQIGPIGPTGPPGPSDATWREPTIFSSVTNTDAWSRSTYRQAPMRFSARHPLSIMTLPTTMRCAR